jgi:hypothetical protein
MPAKPGRKAFWITLSIAVGVVVLWLVMFVPVAFLPLPR